MNSEVEVALIVAVSATSGPLALAWLQARTRRRETQETHEREDEVARRAAVAAAANVEAQKAVASAAESANGKLDMIHTLVNSNMTSEMKRVLVATQGQLVLLRRVIRLNEKAGENKTPDDDAAVKALQDQIAEMQSSLAERAKQQEIADKQAETAAATAT